MMRRRSYALAAALGLLGLQHTWADQTELAPSPAVQCLSREGDDAKLEYPPLMLQRKDGGTVFVEMVFTGPSRAPRVKVLDESTGLSALVGTVVDHVRHFRVPCMSDAGPPVVLRQSYVFTPNDGRKVAVSAARDDADVSRQRQVACLKHVKGQVRPDYPLVSLRYAEQGNVFIKLSFIAPDQPPQTEVLAATRHYALRAAVESYVAGLRLPCIEQGPVNLHQLYKFRIDGGARTLIKDMALRQLLEAAEDMPAGVFFDTTTMGCPFDARLTYWRPHRPNRLHELEESQPAREPLLDWLSNLKLKLSPAMNTAVLGQTITVRVPCGSIDF